jgi:hypothetical protein
MFPAQVAHLYLPVMDLGGGDGGALRPPRFGKFPELLAEVSKPAGRGKMRAGYGRIEAARVGREEQE